VIDELASGSDEDGGIIVVFITPPRIAFAASSAHAWIIVVCSVAWGVHCLASMDIRIMQPSSWAKAA
jgi:hypothetical protein